MERKVLTNMEVLSIIIEQLKIVRESAGIGRQARLRGVWQPSCEFKSHLSHHVNETRFSNSFIEKRVSSCLQSLEKPRLFFFIC